MIAGPLSWSEAAWRPYSTVRQCTEPYSIAHQFTELHLLLPDCLLTAGHSNICQSYTLRQTPVNHSGGWGHTVARSHLTVLDPLAFYSFIACAGIPQ